MYESNSCKIISYFATFIKYLIDLPDTGVCEKQTWLKLTEGISEDYVDGPEFGIHKI